MPANTVREYIGARYVLKIYENSQNPNSADWEANTEYEPLVFVTYNNSSYISRKTVPATVGNPVDNPSYWALSGFYNGQIANLQDQISANKIFVNVEQFGASGDGVTDDTNEIQAAIDYALANGCGVIAPKSYKVTNLTISSSIYDGFTFIFNKIVSDSVNPAITIEGQTINIIGTLLLNQNGDCLQCGGDNFGLGGSTISINFIRSYNGNCITLKANASGNVQDCVFNVTRLVYHTHAVNIDTTDKFVGEITFNGTWFNADDMSLNNFAIYSDCSNYGMTGLYLNSCSFEGAGGGIQVMNTSPTNNRMFAPLFGFGLRTSELTEQYSKTFIDYHGNGRLFGSIHCDSIPLDKIIINDNLSSVIAASPFEVVGRVRIASGVGVFSNRAILNADGMAICVDDVNNTLVIGTANTYTDTIPVVGTIRANADLTFNFSTFRFNGELTIICDSVGRVITVNGAQFTATKANEVLKIKCSFTLGVTFRYYVEQDNKIAIINPLP